MTLDILLLPKSFTVFYFWVTLSEVYGIMSAMKKSKTNYGITFCIKLDVQLNE